MNGNAASCWEPRNVTGTDLGAGEECSGPLWEKIFELLMSYAISLGIAKTTCGNFGAPDI